MKNEISNNKELERVNGGTVVAGNDGQYYAVDKQGCVLYSGSTESIALYGARKYGLTQEIITEKKYVNQFGRKLDEN